MKEKASQNSKISFFLSMNACPFETAVLGRQKLCDFDERYRTSPFHFSFSLLNLQVGKKLLESYYCLKL